MGPRQQAGRRTNLALLAVLGLALLTGTLAYGVGAPPATSVVTTAHAAVGLGLLLLVPWKAVLVRRGLRRGEHPGRTAGMVLAVLLAVVVAAGIAQEAVGWTVVAGLSPLQVHVTAALLAVPILGGHLVTHWQRPRRVDLDRRALLRTGVLAAGALGAVAVVDAATSVLRLPGRRDRSTGSTETGSGRPSAMPVTSWFDDRVPASVPPLVVAGARVVVRPQDEVVAVLDCTGGWYAEQTWGGLRLDRLLPRELPPDVRSIDVVSVTGYRRRFPLEDAPRLLLATHAGGAPLSPGHGAPHRLVAPGRRGFWWVKWVERVELSTRPPWVQPPFPLS